MQGHLDTFWSVISYLYTAKNVYFFITENWKGRVNLRRNFFITIQNNFITENSAGEVAFALNVLVVYEFFFSFIKYFNNRIKFYAILFI